MKYIKGYLDRFLGIYMYRISRKFCDDLIFVTSFKSQIIEYEEIISYIIFYVKLKKNKNPVEW